MYRIYLYKIHKKWAFHPPGKPSGFRLNSITKKNIVELEYKVREGILVTRVNPNETDENGKYLIDVWYKPVHGYGINFYICGLYIDSLDQANIDDTVEMIYNANIEILLDTIADIYNDTFEFCGADVEELMQDEGIRNYVEKYL